MYNLEREGSYKSSFHISEVLYQKERFSPEEVTQDQMVGISRKKTLAHNQEAFSKPQSPLTIKVVTLLILKGFIGIGDCVHGLPVNHSSYDSKYIKNIMKLYMKIESKESDLSDNSEKVSQDTEKKK